MTDKGIFRKELNAAKFRILAGLPILLITALFLPLSYDYMMGIIQKNPIPGMFTQQVGQLKNYSYYIWSQWFGKNLLQFTTILALIFGSGQISSEVSGKTIYFLLARPISREKIYSLKFFINLISLESIMLISSLVLYGVIFLTGKSYPAMLFFANHLLLAAGVAVFFSIAMFCSNLFDQSMKAFLASGLVAFLFSLPGYFEPLRKFSVFYHMGGKEMINGTGFPFIAFGVMILCTGIFYKLGMRQFAARDW